MTFLEILSKGGPIVYLIGLVSLVALTVAFERLWHYQRATADVRALLDEVRVLLSDGFLHQALAKCDETPGPAAKVVRTVLKNHQKDPASIRYAVDTVLLEETSRLRRRLTFLPVLAQVATLLGLLGTILGMIVTFHAIAREATGVVNVHILSTGIWQALITTAAGLTVAIPTILVYEFLHNKVRRFVTEAEQAASLLLPTVQHAAARAAAEDEKGRRATRVAE